MTRSNLVVLWMALVVGCAVFVDAVTVSGFAHAFIGDEDIVGGTVTWLETGFTVTTDSNGRFSFDAPAGSDVTLVLEADGYHTTQSSTVTVPPGGLVGIEHEMAMQVPRSLTFEALSLILPGHVDPTKCHLVTTVCAFNKTLYNLPQGEPGSTIALQPAVEGAVPFYFGVFWNNYTDPFVKGLTETSLDGGAMFFNVPVGDYIMTASKSGVVFNNPPNARFRCIYPGSFLNAAPPHGPRVGNPSLLD